MYNSLSYMYREFTDVNEALKFIKESIGLRHVTIIIAPCTVEYYGRGSSSLGLGERVILIKQDGAMLIHRPTGYQPVNWQPDISSIEVKSEGGVIEIAAVRNDPREMLVVKLSLPIKVLSCKLVDSADFTKYLDESGVRDIIFKHPEVLEDGLRLVEKEKVIGDLSVDLFGYDKNGNPVLIEVKRVRADGEAVLQLFKYVEEYRKSSGIKPRGILVAPERSQGALELLEKLGLEFKKVNLRKLWKLKAEEVEGGSRSILEFSRR
ncbi:MAG: endonuclease NucS [Desulfurococcaceae archaeon]|nr:endonuclease NucS [Sulfolobales archaeon]MDW8170692.1 endonuclease NucS [Desulfurococcaceae archaeon]